MILQPCLRMSDHHIGKLLRPGSTPKSRRHKSVPPTQSLSSETYNLSPEPSLPKPSMEHEKLQTMESLLSGFKSLRKPNRREHRTYACGGAHGNLELPLAVAQRATELCCSQAPNYTNIQYLRRLCSGNRGISFTHGVLAHLSP